MNRISPIILHQLLIYESDTGKVFWRERGREFFSRDQDWQGWNTRYSGNEAGHINGHGYREIKVFGTLEQSHRIIWAMQTGAWPENQIDHINHDRADNRWVNLREATHAENGRNQVMQPTNTSGVVGVCWHKTYKKWTASIMVNGKRFHLGFFVSIAEATATRKTAEIEYGFHENHGASAR